MMTDKGPVPRSKGKKNTPKLHILVCNYLILSRLEMRNEGCQVDLMNGFGSTS